MPDEKETHDITTPTDECVKCGDEALDKTNVCNECLSTLLDEESTHE